MYHCLLWSCFAKLVSTQLPEYERNYKILMDMSNLQSKLFILDAWHLPKMVNANPAVVVWPFGTKPLILLLWCPRKAWKPPCQYSLFESHVFYDPKIAGSKAPAWKKSVEYDDFRYGHVVEDARVYRLQNRLHMVYSVRVQGSYIQHYTEIHYNTSADSLYLNFPTNKVVRDKNP